MKWFCTTNESSLYDDGFFDLITVAVMSASKNTTLDANLLYEGKNNERIRYLNKLGVNVVKCNLEIRKNIEYCVEREYGNLGEEKVKKMVNTRAGAYLRAKIPSVVKEEGIDDKYVLYTDCDVIFAEDPNVSSFKPHYLAACGRKEGGYTRFNIGGWMHYNTGVMVMNVDNLYSEAEKFKDFVLNDGYDVKRPDRSYWKKNLLIGDQVAYNLYFSGKIDSLPQKYNWNPSFGINYDAKIIHFYGPKWTQWEEYTKGDLRPKLEKMIEENRESYKHYRSMAKKIKDLYS